MCIMYYCNFQSFDFICKNAAHHRETPYLSLREPCKFCIRRCCLSLKNSKSRFVDEGKYLTQLACP